MRGNYHVKQIAFLEEMDLAALFVMGLGTFVSFIIL